MQRDSVRSHIHLTAPKTCTVFDEWMQDKLEFDHIDVAPEHDTQLSDDDDGLVADGASLFGTRNQHHRATKKTPAWKDLGVHELFANGPQTPDRTIIAPPFLSEKEVREGLKLSRLEAAGKSKKDDRPERPERMTARAR